MLRAALLAALLFAGFACSPGEKRPPAPPATKGPAIAGRVPRIDPRSDAPPGLPASPGDERLVAAATAFLAPPVEAGRCGPYLLYTDLAGVVRARTSGLCEAVAAKLDDEYRSRLGLPLHGEAAGTLVLFASRSRFRDYLAADAKGAGGGLPAGYAGFSLPYAGLVVLPAGDVTEASLAQTLAHELSHLAHRRAFGRELPPWLAEGLADAVGDSATPGGFLALADPDPVAGIRKRLCGAYEIGRAGNLERLAGLRRGEFDRDAVSFDYEQSALFTRFLLLDTELGPRFRGWLETQARTPLDALPLDRALALSWTVLEQRFTGWLRCAPPP